MKVEWKRDPASDPGPLTLAAEVAGAGITVAERGNHWFARVRFPDGGEWSALCRTEEEAKTQALRAVGDRRQE